MTIEESTAILLAIGAAAVLRWWKWKPLPRPVVIGLCLVLGLGMGMVIVLVHRAIDSISSNLALLVGLAVILFEGYRWQRRRHRQQS
jgi:hypothetical protein